MSTTTEPAPGSGSPLAIIEQRVLERAKDQLIDLEDAEAERRLQNLIDEEIAQWSLDHKHGRRPYDLPAPDLLAERAFNNLARYGPLTGLLEDDDVWEIMINSPDQIFIERHTGVSGYHDEAFHDDEHVQRILTKLLDEASTAHRKLDPSEGLQDAQLDDGSRLHIVHGDVGKDSHLVVNIRKFTGVAFGSLEELVARGMLSAQASGFLEACMQARASIVFAGPPGSGKTTMLSCCAAELDPALRVVTAEEVFEVDVPLPNVASMQTRAARQDRPAVDLRRLVSGFLRMAPDVAIVGEVRDQEALPLLLTLSSGVTGYTTIHAGSARQALSRLRFICQLADTRSELPVAALNALVTDSIDVVVHQQRFDGRPLVTEIVCVEDLAGGDSASQFTITPVFGRKSGDGPMSWTGAIPARLRRRLDRAGIDVGDLLDPARGTGDLPSPQELQR